MRGHVADFSTGKGTHAYSLLCFQQTKLEDDSKDGCKCSPNYLFCRYRQAFYERTEAVFMRTKSEAVVFELLLAGEMFRLKPRGSFPFLDGQTINFLIGSRADAACSSLSHVDSSASGNGT